ncbi:MAG: amidohydrolase family protein [Chitinophagaceae bacterium]
MRRFVLLLLIALVNRSQAQQVFDFVISNPTIIDVNNGALIKQQDILVKGNRIAGIVPHRAKYAVNVKIADASGKYVIPGLWDMHMHFGGGDSLLEENKNLFPLFIANGITAVRDAAADISGAVLQWRKQVAEGSLMGPTIFTSGPKLEGIKSIWIGDLEVGTVEEMNKALDSLQGLHVDFIKITDNTIKPSLYLEAVKEARKRGFKISGHVPYALTMQQVTDAGLSSVEHMGYVLKAGAKNEAAIANGLANGTIAGAAVMPMVLQNFDTAYALKVYRHMAAVGTAVTPTLSISRATSFLDQEDHWKDDYLKYLGQGLKNTYWWRVKRAAKDSAAQIALRHLVFEKSAGLLPLLHKAGVMIMAGTDAGYLNSFDYPGQSLHTELSLMVQYGLTPLQALQTAIINGPRYFGKQREYGRIAKSFYADILVLDKNPLEDIHNTQAINGVMVKGHYYSRADLDKLLAEVAAKAAASPFKPIE